MRLVSDMQKTYTVKRRDFYCDRCGKLIGTRCEDEYGQPGDLYAGMGHIESTNFIFNKRFELNGEFCEECRDEIDKAITNTLTECGYKYSFIQRPKFNPENAACSSNSNHLTQV